MYDEERAIATQDLLPILIGRLEVLEVGQRREGRKDRANVTKAIVKDLHRQHRIVNGILQNEKEVNKPGEPSEREEDALRLPQEDWTIRHKNDERRTHLKV